MSKPLYEQFKIWKSIFIWQYLRLSDLLAPVVTMQNSPCICCSSETKRSYTNLPPLPKPYPFSTRNINTQLRPTAEKETEKLFCPLKKDYGQLPKRERKKNTTKNHKVTARDTAGWRRDTQTTAMRQSSTVMTCKAAAKRYRAHCLIICACLQCVWRNVQQPFDQSVGSENTISILFG